MSEPWQTSSRSPTPRQVVGKAIQDVTAARLGRGFVPLGLLCLAGLVQLAGSGAGGSGAWALALGAPLTGAAMLAFGLRVVQRALGRKHRAWMSAAMLGSLIPPMFALYVLAWRGLRGLALGGGPVPVLLAATYSVIGVWVLRSWMRVVEVQRLARVMATDFEEYGGAA